MNRPSPRPRPKPAAENTITEKSPSERLTGQPDKAPAKRRGRSAIVEFLGRTWNRDETVGQVGWTLAHECLATPELLERLKAQHATEDGAK